MKPIHLERLRQVHPDLQKVIMMAEEIHPVPFIVTEGLRTIDRQKELVRLGASKTLHSRHLTGHAVDLAVVVNDQVLWDWPLYSDLARSVKLAAETLDVPIEWGGDWKSFPDGPHFQLPFSSYTD